MSLDQQGNDPTIKGCFKDLVSLLIHRVNTANGRLYQDDPAIFAWELANKPRASSAAPCLHTWIGETSARLRAPCAACHCSVSSAG